MLMFSTTPKTSTFTWRNISIALRTSARATVDGVVTTTAPVTATVWIRPGLDLRLLWFCLRRLCRWRPLLSFLRRGSGNVPASVGELVLAAFFTSRKLNGLCGSKFYDILFYACLSSKSAPLKKGGYSGRRSLIERRKKPGRFGRNDKVCERRQCMRVAAILVNGSRTMWLTGTQTEVCATSRITTMRERRLMN